MNPDLKRELAKYRRAAKWRSRTGPQEDALVLWESVERLEAQLKERLEAQLKKQEAQP